MLISAVSAYEAALIGLETESGQRSGRRAVRMLPTVPQRIREAIAGTRVVPVALDAETALLAATHQTLHPDPFDRIILATAASHGATLVTADAKMMAYGGKAGVKLLEP